MTPTTDSDPMTAVIDFNTGSPALDELLDTIDTALGRLIRSTNQCIVFTIERPAAPAKRLYIVSSSETHDLFHRHTVDEMADTTDTSRKQSRRDVLRTVYMEGRTNDPSQITTRIVDRLAISNEAPVLNDTHLSRLHRGATPETAP